MQKEVRFRFGITLKILSHVKDSFKLTTTSRIENNSHALYKDKINQNMIDPVLKNLSM